MAGTAEKSVIHMDLATHRLVEVGFHLQNTAALVVVGMSSDSAKSLAG